MNKHEQNIQYAVATIAKLAKFAGRYFTENNITLSSNAESLYQYEFPDIHMERQKKYKEIIENKVKQIFNIEEQKKIGPLFKKEEGLFINVADHHGIINHPWVYTCFPASRFNSLFTRQKNGRPIVTLNCGNCSLGEFTHRRGFDFKAQHINLFPKKDKNQLVYAAPIKDFKIVERLVKAGKHVEYSEAELGFLKEIDELIAGIDFSTCKRYSDQITKINYYLWPLLFTKELRPDLIDLVYLEHDEILITYLLDFLRDKDTIIYKMLFNEDFRGRVIVDFRGKYSGWEEEKNYGTHFFWYIDEAGVQNRLYLNKDNQLETDKGVRIDFTQQSILENLQEKKLIPGMFLKFSVVIGHLGIIPLGGFGSVNYISSIKEYWINNMPLEFKSEVEFIKQIKTDGIVTIPFSFGYSKREDKVIDLSAFDVIYQGGMSQEYLRKADQLTIDNFMRPAVERSYNYYTYLYMKNKKPKKIKFDKQTVYEPIKKLFI